MLVVICMNLVGLRLAHRGMFLNPSIPENSLLSFKRAIDYRIPIELDVTLTKDLVPVVDIAINSEYKELSSESQASILTAGIIGEQYIGITPGFYDENLGTTYLQDGDYINNTKSAVVLEDLIAKFLYNSSVGDEANAQ